MSSDNNLPLQSEVVDSVDVTIANELAAGSMKKRIVAAGLGGRLMGTKDIVDVSAEQIAKDSLSLLVEKDKQSRANSAKNKHISEQPWTRENWHQHVNWLNFILVLFIPLCGLLSTPFVILKWQTALLSILLYTLSGVSITAGYHRMWSHRAYKGRLPLRLFYAFFGAGAVEGSIKWWGHSHRVHHRYTDTPRDPYDARRGFWYSHMGWMLQKPNPKYKARADISDFIDDWVVRVQHRHYLLFMFSVSYILPTLIAGLCWGDYLGGFIYGGILKTFLIQQATFCVNSLAHWIGVQPFDDRRTPRDHFLTALVTFGEGYHNFHHEFPSDYRNALKWYQYDPTKIIIWATAQMGLAYDLKTFSQNAIEQGLVQQQQKKLDRLRTSLNWGTPLSELPVWDKQEFFEKSKTEKGLCIISGIVHNVEGFLTEHPGGSKLIKTAMGKDATTAFNGGVYAHSNAAHNLLATMRVAVIRDSGAVGDTFQVQNEMIDAKRKSYYN